VEQGHIPAGSNRQNSLLLLPNQWGDNTKANFQEVGSVGVDLIEVAQDRDRWRVLVNAVMNLRVSI
jgi:hypothetical protein